MCGFGINFDYKSSWCRIFFFFNSQARFLKKFCFSFSELTGALAEERSCL